MSTIAIRCRAILARHDGNNEIPIPVTGWTLLSIFACVPVFAHLLRLVLAWSSFDPMSTAKGAAEIYGAFFLLPGVLLLPYAVLIAFELFFAVVAGLRQRLDQGFLCFGGLVDPACQAVNGGIYYNAGEAVQNHERPASVCPNFCPGVQMHPESSRKIGCRQAEHPQDEDQGVLEEFRRERHEPLERIVSHACIPFIEDGRTSFLRDDPDSECGY